MRISIRVNPPRLLFLDMATHPITASLNSGQPLLPGCVPDRRPSNLFRPRRRAALISGRDNNDSETSVIKKGAPGSGRPLRGTLGSRNPLEFECAPFAWRYR